MTWLLGWWWLWRLLWNWVAAAASQWCVCVCPGEGPTKELRNSWLAAQGDPASMACRSQACQFLPIAAGLGPPLPGAAAGVGGGGGCAACGSCFMCAGGCSQPPLRRKQRLLLLLLRSSAQRVHGADASAVPLTSPPAGPARAGPISDRVVKPVAPRPKPGT